MNIRTLARGVAIAALLLMMQIAIGWSFAATAELLGGIGCR